jgi:hypothetical protein
MRCPTCDGKGGWYEWVEDLPGWWQVCPHCHGDKWVGFTNWFWYTMPVWFIEWYSELRYGKESE